MGISQQKYYWKNKEKINKNKREYYKKNKETILERMKKSYDNNPEKFKDRDKIYCKNNREKVNARKRRYMKTMRGKQINLRRSQIRRSIKKNTIIKFSLQEWIDKRKLTNGICPMCKKFIGIEKLTLDHIYPVSRANKDYLETGIKRIYTINDIQPLCIDCNIKKGTNIIGEIKYD